jgi:hypothetical protein
MNELVSLLVSAQHSKQGVSVHIGEVIACILARIASTPENRDAVRQSGATAVLLEWLSPDWHAHPKVQSAALGALASLAYEHLPTASHICTLHRTLPSSHY